MMEKIIYFDNDGHLLREDDISALTSFVRVYLDQESNFKLVEFIDDKVVTGLEFFLSDNETYGQVFERYPQFEYINFYQGKSASGKYSKYEVYTVSKAGILESKRIKVLSENLLPIYDMAINPENGQTVYFAKHYYDLKRNISFEFEYNETNGALEKITVYDPGRIIDTDHHTILPGQIGIGKNSFDFDWKGLEYYKFADPVLPEE